MRRFWAKKCRRDHLRSLWRSVVLVTVCTWQHREAAEGRWGSLTKCGITKLVTVRHGYDGPSCKFVMKIREVIPVPRFQELKCFGTKNLDGPLFLWRSVILANEGNEESSRRNCTSMGQRSPRRSVDPAAFWQISSNWNPCLIRFCFLWIVRKTSFLRLDTRLLDSFRFDIILSDPLY